MSVSSQIHPVVSTEAIAQPDEQSAELHDGHATEVPYGNCDKTNNFGKRSLRRTVATSCPLLLADVASLAICLYLGAGLSTLFSGWQIPVGIHKHFLVLSVAYVFVGIRLGLFPASGVSPVYELRQQVTAASMAYLLLLTANGILGKTTYNELLTVCLALPISAVVMPATRYLARCVCANGSWWGQPVVIVGAGPTGRAIWTFYESARTRGFRPIGLVDDEPNRQWEENEADSPPFLGTLDDLSAICAEHGIASAIVIVSDRSDEETRRILAKCSGIPDVTVLSNRLFLPSLWVRSCDLAGLAGVRIQDQLLSPFSLLFKRLLDIISSVILLILAAPMFLLTAAVVKLKSPGPVFYGHQRIGRNGKHFTAWKIRTMVLDAPEVLERVLATDPAAREEWAQTQKLKNDPRIIPGRISRFQRRTSLDELPQLWNVLRGDMSLVGPRPIVDDEVDKYSDMFSLYLRVRPGLTGLWQVSGRNNTTYQDRVRLDSYYVRNWSPWLDYYILLRTIRTIVLREGAF